MHSSRFVSTLYVLLMCLVLWGSLSCEASDNAQEDGTYYAIEIKGVLCGYAETRRSPIEEGGREMILIEERIYMMLKALGMEFDSKIDLVYHFDPATGRFTYQETDIKQGPTELSSAVHVEGDTARVKSTLVDQEKVVLLPPDAILESSFTCDFLFEDFRDGSLREKTYDVFEPREGELHPTTFTRAGDELLTLGGLQYNALMFDALNEQTGMKTKWWIDADTGRILKFIPIADRLIYLADRSVMNKIKRATLDELVMSKTNVTIADIPSIAYMKVKAVIEPVGLRVSPEGLNVPGQRFAGSVEDNLIEGVFEIEHPRYEGADAPPFPPDFGEEESLREFLEPQEFIESRDPEISARAREITEGAKDSWEAATRLSRWVAENIAYAIPGGTTARKTYEIRAGECGAHSLLLAAFCRSVGIPARVVWGCMYTPQNGGSFGQHGWNEIYMGKAGWIPVDATAMEVDFVDSGHLRIGVLEGRTISFNPHDMVILDYRVGPADSSGAGGEAGEYDAYVGEYQGHRETLKVFVKDGRLALDVPGRMVLAFKDPDGEGRLYCTMANHVYLTFDGQESGEARVMAIHEVVKLPRKPDPERTGDGAPQEYRRYLGVYHLAALQADFEVVHGKDGLAVKDPLEKRTVKIRPTGDGERWIDEFDKNYMAFEEDAEGNVTTLVIDSITKCPRK